MVSIQIQYPLQFSDVRKLTLEIPTTTLPAKDTTYYCKLIALPSDQDYHLVATEPIIRSDVIHHIDVYGCTDQGNFPMCEWGTSILNSHTFVTRKATVKWCLCDTFISPVDTCWQFDQSRTLDHIWSSDKTDSRPKKKTAFWKLNNSHTFRNTRIQPGTAVLWWSWLRWIRLNVLPDDDRRLDCRLPWVLHVRRQLWISLRQNCLQNGAGWGTPNVYLWTTQLIYNPTLQHLIA